MIYINSVYTSLLPLSSPEFRFSIEFKRFLKTSSFKVILNLLCSFNKPVFYSF